MTSGPKTGKPSNKLLYEQPILKVYGSVKALTATGTKPAPEGPGANAAKKPSDRNIKENIIRIGTHALGIGLYLFNYKLAHQQTWGQGRKFGVMSDEVERVLPEAVGMHSGGYKLVDYAMLGITTH